MSTFTIKLIAITTMLIDHIGLFFFPDILTFRIIGRLSFPLFAWLIANGAYHTHNLNNYLKRLFIFACIAQIPFILAHQRLDPSFWYLNVLFTLFLGLIAIKFIKQTKEKYVGLFLAFLCALAAQLLKTDYGSFGVISIVLFYLFYNRRLALIISQAILWLGFPLFLITLSQFNRFTIPQLWYIEPINLLSLIFITRYNHQQGPKTQYLFYTIYPLQYFLIYLLKTFL